PAEGLTPPHPRPSRPAQRGGGTVRRRPRRRAEERMVGGASQAHRPWPAPARSAVGFKPQKTQKTRRISGARPLPRPSAFSAVRLFFVKFFAASPLLCSTYVLMHTAADIAREQDAGLQQLFQAGLELALQVQANAMAAEPEAQARLSLTFHRLARGVRQTAALRMKLAHAAARSERDQAAEAVK